MEPKRALNTLNANVMRITASRRTLLIGGGVATAGVLAVAAGSPRRTVATPVGPLDPSDASPLGDGYFLVDGWVMSAADLNLDGAAD